MGNVGEMTPWADIEASRLEEPSAHFQRQWIGSKQLEAWGMRPVHVGDSIRRQCPLSSKLDVMYLRR